MAKKWINEKKAKKEEQRKEKTEEMNAESMPNIGYTGCLLDNLALASYLCFLDTTTASASPATLPPASSHSPRLSLSQVLLCLLLKTGPIIWQMSVPSLR